MPIIETVSLDRFREVMGDNFTYDNTEEIYNYLWDLGEQGDGGQFMLEREIVKDMFREVTLEELAEKTSFESYQEYFADNIYDALAELEAFPHYVWRNGRWEKGEPAAIDARYPFFEALHWPEKQAADAPCAIPYEKLDSVLDFFVLCWHSWLNKQDAVLINSMYPEGHIIRKFMKLTTDEILDGLHTKDETTLAKLAAKYTSADDDSLWFYLEEDPDNVVPVLKHVMTMRDADEISTSLSGMDAPLYDDWRLALLKYAQSREIILCEEDPNAILLFS